MFDQMTRVQLHELHELLYRLVLGLYDQLIGPDALQPRVEPGSSLWTMLYAKLDRTHDLMAEVYAEMTRRDQEAAAWAAQHGMDHVDA